MKQATPERVEPAVVEEGDDDRTESDIAVGGDAAEIECRTAVVDASAHGERLDKFLVSMAPEFSRSHLQQLIEAGHVRAGAGGPLRAQRTASRRVAAGQRVEVDLLPTAQSTAFQPEAMALEIVHEDAALLVVNKPVGLVVHPAAGNWSGTLLNGLLAHHAGAAQLARAGIVHRLDKDTSGLMVVAKTLEAQTALVRAIAAREVHRQYLALAHGEISIQLTRVDAPIGRDPVARVRMAVVAGGKPARTDIERLALQGQGRAAVTALRCTLHTGRTHQIRVHLAFSGHPLLGDTVYGGRPLLGLQRQALHAVRLALVHPVTGVQMAWQAPLPPDMAAAWAATLGNTLKEA
jgi:23S rRNA pseudouridine1911/1915/1917 synthase